MLGLASTVSSSSTPESKYSLDFDGADDYVSLGASNSIMTTSQNEASLSVWIKATGAESNGRYIFQNQKGDGSTNFGLRINNSTGLAEALIWNGSNHCNPSSTTDVTDGNWHHVVITGKASEQKIYVDGSVEDTHSEAFSMIPSVDDCTIGSLNGGADDATAFFNGKIDNVALWSVALDADAVEAIYNNGKPTNLTFDDGDKYDNSSALVAYYRMGNGSFDDKANGVVHDQHASGFGSEMVTNGHFDTNVSGWTQHLDNASSITQGTYGGRSGVARVVISTTGTTDRFRQDITWEKDALYYFSVDVYLLSGKFRIDGVDEDIIGAGPGSGADVLGTITYDAAVDDRWRTLTGYAQGQRTGGTDQVWIRSNGIAAEFYIDNFSIKKLNGFPGLTSGDIPFTSDAP